MKFDELFANVIGFPWGGAVTRRVTERGLHFLRIQKCYVRRNPSPSSLRDAISPLGEAYSQIFPSNYNCPIPLLNTNTYAQ